MEQLNQQHRQPIKEKTETKPPIKTNWKLIAIIAFIAVVVSVAGILLLRELSPAPAEPTPPIIQQPSPPAPSPQPQATNNPQSAIDTSDWQTYRNEEFGFEVRYPSDWEVTSPFAEKTPEAVRFAKLIEREGDAAFDIIVEANPLKKPATKEWYLDWLKHFPAGVDTSKYIFETMDFHGYQAVKVNNTELFFAKDIYMFRIRFNVSIYDPDRGFADYAKPILDQILSTFRFVE